jgi:hypothetical protein
MSAAKRGLKTSRKPLEHAAMRALKADPQVCQPPLPPQKKLFIGLLAAFAVWIAVLIGMYLKTVYLPRHASPVTAPSARF